MERPKKKPRRRTIRRTSGKPWPDTHGVAHRQPLFAECKASGSANTPKRLTTTDGEQLRFGRPVGSLEGSGGPPPGCIRESAAKTPPKALGALGSKAHRLRHHVRHRSHLFHHHIRHQSRFFRHRARRQHHCLQRRGPLEFLAFGLQRHSSGRRSIPLRARVVSHGKDEVGRYTGARALDASSSKLGRCLTQRSPTSNTTRTSCSSKDDVTRSSGTRDDVQGAAEKAAAPVITQ